MNFAIFDGKRYRLQWITIAGAGDAFARIDDKQRIMCCALNQRFIQIEKLVLLPFETGTGMRAFIVIRKKFTVFVHHKDGASFAFDFEFETFAAGVFDIGGFAEYVRHNVC